MLTNESVLTSPAMRQVGKQLPREDEEHSITSVTFWPKILGVIIRKHQTDPNQPLIFITLQGHGK